MQSAPNPSNGGPLLKAQPAASYNPSSVSTSDKTSQESPESSSLPTSCSANSSPLERRIAELEREKLDLTQLVTEAEKRAVAAENETAAAKQRAQDRYTEKLHANNEARHLRIEIDKQLFLRKDFRIKVEKILRSLKDKIIELETEKANTDVSTEHNAKIEELEGQLNDMQAGFLASQEEKATIKFASDRTITDHKKHVANLEFALAAAQKMTAAVTSVPTAEDIQARIDAAKSEAVRDSKSKFQEAIEEHKANYNRLEIELKQSMQKQLKDAQSQWHSKLKVLETELCSKGTQLEAAKKEMESLRRQLHVNVTTQANMQKSHVQQQHLSVSQQAYSPNKKRKLNSNEITNMVPHGYQPSQTQSFTPGSNQNGRNMSLYPNNEVSIVAPHNNEQQSMRVTLNGGHGQHPSLLSNAPAGPTALSQPQWQHDSVCKLMATQNNAMSPQLGSAFEFQPSRGRSKPQQKNYVQGQRSTNAGYVIPSNSQLQPRSHQGQDQYSGFDVGVTQNLYNSAVQAPSNAPMYNQMHRNNGMTEPFPTPMQADSNAPGFGGDALTTTAMPPNDDLFSNEPWGYPFVSENTMAQGPTHEGMFGPTTTNNGVQDQPDTDSFLSARRKWV